MSNTGNGNVLKNIADIVTMVVAMEIRKYQQDCLDTIIESFEKFDRQLIQLPTGAGKTAIFLSYLKHIKGRALILCPTIDVCEQIQNSCVKWHIPSVSIKNSGHPFRCSNSYIIVAHALNFSATREFLSKVKFDIIIIDEAHRAQCSTYKNFIENYPHKTKILGVTATPERLDNKPLLEIFHNFTFSMEIVDLIEQGYLVDLESYRIRTGLRLVTRKVGDFSLLDLKSLDNDSRNSIILDTYFKNCIGKKTLIFCISVDHSERMSEALVKKGIRAMAMHGDLPSTERKRILQDFKSGKLEVLTNCQLLTEGFDEPSIEAIIIARPTKSKTLYCQMIGRGLRPFKDKNRCYLYELTDNAYKICTFNVLLGIPQEKDLDYENGSLLSKEFRERKHKDLISIDIKDVNYEKVKIDILNYKKKFQSYMHSIPAPQRQKDLLTKIGIEFYPDLSVLEFCFLLWKEKLKVKYGTR